MYDESESYINDLFNLKPDMPEAFVRRGFVYDINKKYEEAIVYTSFWI